MIKAPSFWQNPLPWYGKFFLWISFVYDVAVQRRLKKIRPLKLSVPVICVGNLTMGGTGKTPVAISLAQHFLNQNKKVGFLSRGYGGSEKGPLKINIHHHCAQEVGDEPLLLARVAPTWISKDKIVGARAMIKNGIELIIMDDGHQNPFLFKDISVVVVDGLYGFGNKQIFPLGPLRESLESGLSRADIVVTVRAPSDVLIADLKTHFAGPILEADAEISLQELVLDRIFVFCGIGNPQKFLSSLQKLKLNIVGFQGFPDHYFYKAKDITALKKSADLLKASLVTTEKDWVRLEKKDQRYILPVPLILKWKNWAKMEKVLENKIK